jgi:CHASE2 domain-containing sensor protein
VAGLPVSRTKLLACLAPHRYLKPYSNPTVFVYDQRSVASGVQGLDELEKGSDEERAIMTSRFILVGEDSVQDRFSTPYGVQPGIVIHANAIYSLRQNRFIHRGVWWVSLMLIFLLCYLNLLLAFRCRSGVTGLILINLFFSFLTWAITALLMYLWLTWIDLIYPLLAAWLFVFTLIIWRKWAR